MARALRFAWALVNQLAYVAVVYHYDARSRAQWLRLVWQAALRNARLQVRYDAARKAVRREQTYKKRSSSCTKMP